MATILDMPIGQARSADMLICHCYQVTASAIRRAIDEGDAELVEEVSRMTSAGAGWAVANVAFSGCWPDCRPSVGRARCARAAVSLRRFAIVRLRSGNPPLARVWD